MRNLGDTGTKLECGVVNLQRAHKTFRISRPYTLEYSLQVEGDWPDCEKSRAER